jgi:plastocyanin
MRRPATVPAILLLALLGGCGSSSSSSNTSSAPASTPTSGGAASTPAAAPKPGGGKTVVVKMQNIAFVPQTITVRAGQAVKWVNEDAVAHNVIAQSGSSFHSPDFTKGGTYTFTPTAAGTIAYVCTIHPNMTATLNVTP